MLAVVQIGSRILRSAWLTIRSVPCARAGRAIAQSTIDSSNLGMRGPLPAGADSHARFMPCEIQCPAMRTLLLLVPVLLLLPATVFAQSPAADLAYCNRLADLYERYIGRNEFSPGRSFGRGSLDGDV